MDLISHRKREPILECMDPLTISYPRFLSTEGSLDLVKGVTNTLNSKPLFDGGEEAGSAFKPPPDKVAAAYDPESTMEKVPPTRCDDAVGQRDRRAQQKPGAEVGDAASWLFGGLVDYDCSDKNGHSVHEK